MHDDSLTAAAYAEAGAEYTEHLMEAQLWQRFDEAAYANYWRHRAAS